MNHWRFFAWDSQGNITKRILYRADSTPIKRHVKILSAANPFLKEYVEYFEKRKGKARTKYRGTLLHLLPVQCDYSTYVRGNLHARFLGEWVAEMLLTYPISSRRV
jgi:hypothetical protein